MPVTASAKVYIYSPAGVEIASLLERTFTIGARSTDGTSWTWTPGGLPYGAYTLVAVVSVDGENYGSRTLPLDVREPFEVCIPIATKIEDPASYAWLDATSGGAIVAQGDDTYEYVALPFPFTFYGNAYNGLYVSSNGYVSFGEGYTTYSNSCLPSTGTPNNAIYAFWDDLYPYGGSDGNVYVKQVDGATFVIEWHGVTQYGTSNHETFEIVLKADNSIKVQYQSTENAASATVGVENAGGTEAQQHLCNGAGTAITNESAIRFLTP